MNCVHLLHHAHKRRLLAFAYVLADFTHLSQSAAKIVASMAKVEFRSDIDDVALAQLRHVPRIAFGLDLAEAGFASASSVASRERAFRFSAFVRLSSYFYTLGAH